MDMKIARMTVEMNGLPREATAAVSARLGRRALLLIGLGLFAVVGVAVPYETYKYFKVKQDIAATYRFVEEL